MKTPAFFPRSLTLGTLLFAVALPTSAYASDDVGNSAALPPRVESDARDAAPILGYTYTANGVGRPVVGARGYGIGTVESRRSAQVGGGVTAWGSPIERLTLVGDAARDITGPFAPSFAGIFRLAGNGSDGWSLAALGKFKVDGFAEGPNREMESEVEVGALVSFARAGWHLDVNAIGGAGLGDDGEVDSEGRARFGYDLMEHLRIGADGQARVRLAGTRSLPGGRTWDFTGGPQLIAGFRPFFGALTAGPSSVGTVATLGWSSMLSFGAAAF
jgi:hypothetical protein